MSCYFRHLEDVFLAAGVRLDRENRARVNALIKEITGGEDCPGVWRRLKARLSGEEGWEDFVSQLRKRWRLEQGHIP